MIDLTRTPAGRVTAQCRCDGCGRAALPPAGIDASDLAAECRRLRACAAVALRWRRVARTGGGVGLVCPSCWALSDAGRPKRRWRR